MIEASASNMLCFADFGRARALEIVAHAFDRLRCAGGPDFADRISAEKE
jgi:hypothetical protein